MLIGLKGLNRISGAMPNCFAGQQAVMLSDGTYVCRETFTAQTLGIEAPQCTTGAPFLGTDGNWYCPPAPPAQQSGGGASMFILAAVIAAIAIWVISRSASSAVDSARRGKIENFVPAIGAIG